MLPLAITRRKMLPSPLGDGVGPSNHDRFRGYLSVHLRSGLQFPCLRFAAAVTERHARLGTRLLARPCRGCHFRRLCLTSFQGATPTDPDVRVLPHPAPRQMASLHSGGEVNGRHPRKRIPREEAEKPRPRHRPPLRPTVEPLLPDVHDVEAKRRQARGVPPNPEVGTMPAQFHTNIRCCSAIDKWRCVQHQRLTAELSPRTFWTFAREFSPLKAAAAANGQRL